RKLFGSLSFFFVKLVIYLRDFYSMRKIYTTVSFLLCFAWALLGGPELTSALAQSDCGIHVTSFIELPTEVTVNGILYKRVQVVVNKSSSGFSKLFYYKLNDSLRDGSEEFYEYGYQTEVILIPVDAQKITFYDFLGNETCKVEYELEFEANPCDINFTPDVSIGRDCYHHTVTMQVSDLIKIDSVAWVRRGETEPVHNKMRWVNIPPGTYDIFFNTEEGCEHSTSFETCISTSDAGEDRSIVYCIGEEDTVNLYDLLSPGVDPGS